MKINVDVLTGEIINTPVAVKTDKAPAIVIDVTEVAAFHTDPLGLAKKIEDQAGFAVFDIGSKKGRDECRSHAANIIKCIAPAHKESARLAEEAKAVVKQDLSFRKQFEERVREIAAFHRQPLTEWEAEQERIEKEKIDAENARLAAEQYLSDWQDALYFDELFTLRKIKQEEERRILAEQEAENERLRIEAEVAKRLAEELERAERQRLAEIEAKQIAEAEELRKAKVLEENRIAEIEIIQIAKRQAEVKEAEDFAKVELPKLAELINPVTEYPGLAEYVAEKAVTPIVKHVIETRKTPTKLEIVYQVAKFWDVEPQEAERWIIDAFLEF